MTRRAFLLAIVGAGAAAVAVVLPPRPAPTTPPADDRTYVAALRRVLHVKGGP